MADLREKLVELIGTTQYGNRSYIGQNFQQGFIEKIADHMIANGVTFGKDTNVCSKWIPVTERLPEDDLPKDSKRKSIKVLVTYKTSSGVPVVRTQVREKEPWFNSKGWDWTKHEPITHWMPLPEPPKEG